MKTIKDVDVRNKTVLLRVAFDVPIKDGKVTDDTRIVATLPTIKYLLKNNCRVVLISYLDRPKGKVVEGMKMDPVANRLSKLIKKLVKKLDDCIGTKVREEIKKMKPGDIILLENTRFYKEEDKNDPKFAKELAQNGEIFVNDAFAQSHRNCASIVGIADYLSAYGGLLLEKEVSHLESILKNPKKPLVFVIGGAKISTKIDVLKNILDKVDVLIVGGGMACNFLKAQGFEVGESLIEEDFIDEADEIIRDADYKGVELLLPDDVAVAKEIRKGSVYETKDIMEIEGDDIVVDIGQRTIDKYAEPVKFAGTIFWNGPVGIAEYKEFSKGSTALAKMIAGSKAVSIIGGGDTISFVSKLGLKDKFTLLSTGGGATLEFLEGKELPGIKILRSNK